MHLKHFKRNPTAITFDVVFLKNTLSVKYSKNMNVEKQSALGKVRNRT